MSKGLHAIEVEADRNHKHIPTQNRSSLGPLAPFWPRRRALGMNGNLQIFPQSGYVFVVLSNLDPSAASRISHFIMNRLPKS